MTFKSIKLDLFGATKCQSHRLCVTSPNNDQSVVKGPVCDV